MERKKLYGMLTRHWTPAENEFLAENELIDIIPNFSSPNLKFIQKEYGPFQPQIKSEVPMWLAIRLKHSKKCRIVVPDWMTEDQLKEWLRAEKEDAKFQLKPFYYREMAKLLLTEAADDIPNANSIRILLKDIEEVRHIKLNSGLKDVQPSTYYVDLTNVAASEISSIRHSVTSILNQFEHINNISDPNARLLTDTQSQSQYSGMTQTTHSMTTPATTSFNSHRHNRRNIDDEKQQSPFRTNLQFSSQMSSQPFTPHRAGNEGHPMDTRMDQHNGGENSDILNSQQSDPFMAGDDMDRRNDNMESEGYGQPRRKVRRLRQ